MLLRVMKIQGLQKGLSTKANNVGNFIKTYVIIQDNVQNALKQ